VALELVRVKVTSALEKGTEAVAVSASSSAVPRLVLVFVPQVVLFSPVAINSILRFVLYVLAIFTLFRNIAPCVSVTSVLLCPHAGAW